MWYATYVAIVASVCALSSFGISAQTQQAQYPKPTELPNPYHLVADWPTLPARDLSVGGGVVAVLSHSSAVSAKT